MQINYHGDYHSIVCHLTAELNTVWFSKIKPALFANKKYWQGCEILKQKSVLHAYCTYIVLNGASLQRLRCFD